MSPPEAPGVRDRDGRGDHIQGGSLRTGPQPGDRHAFLRLAVVVVGGVVLAVLLHALAVLVVVLALVAMVMIHELGHFTVAKLSGMKVTEYFLGFGPRLWSVRRGETEYGVKAIPAGGYVRIVGMTTLEEVAPEDEARSYRQASFPRRIAVAVAGSAMHFVMALLLLWGMFAFAGVPVGATAEVAGVAHFANGSSPALAAGVRPGDVLVSVDGHRYALAQQFIDFIRSHAGDPISLVVRRRGHDVTLRMRPVDARRVEVRTGGRLRPELPPSAPRTGIIGVQLNVISAEETVNPLLAIARATTMLGTVTVSTAQGIAQVFSFHGLGSFAHQVAVAGHRATGASPSSSSSTSNGQVLSIVGAVEIGAQAAGHNVSELLYILVAINIFVGMINLFPMLPLDGGHVVIALYERVRSRRGRPYHADVAKLMPVAYLFLAFMLLFGLGALYVNLLHPASLPGG